MEILTLIQRLDKGILDYIYNNLHTPLLDKVMPIISSLGNGGFIWIIIALTLIITKPYRKIGMLLFIALIMTNLLGEIALKNIVQRVRPSSAFPETILLIARPHSYSFPSGHTAIAFASVGILVEAFKKYRTILYIFAFLMGFSRLYLYVHYPIDVIVGALLGFICSKTILYIYEKRLSALAS